MEFEWTQEDTNYIMTVTDRRSELGKRMNEKKLECPACRTRQVQLVGYMNIVPAQWKCRKCKHKFEWEGV
jgi:ribosomal protein L37AE/L43A